jgi:hypothetical protein
MTHSAIGSESCNVREMFTAPYPVVVFPPSLNALYIQLSSIFGVLLFFMQIKVEKHSFTSLKLRKLIMCVLIMNLTCCHTERQPLDSNLLAALRDWLSLVAIQMWFYGSGVFSTHEHCFLHILFLGN